MRLPLTAQIALTPEGKQALTEGERMVRTVEAKLLEGTSTEQAGAIRLMVLELSLKIESIFAAGRKEGVFAKECVERDKVGLPPNIRQ